MLSCLWIWLKQIKNNKNLVKYDYLCSVCGLDYLPPPPICRLHCHDGYNGNTMENGHLRHHIGAICSILLLLWSRMYVYID